MASQTLEDFFVKRFLYKPTDLPEKDTKVVVVYEGDFGLLYLKSSVLKEGLANPHLRIEEIELFLSMNLKLVKEEDLKEVTEKEDIPTVQDYSFVKVLKYKTVDSGKDNRMGLIVYQDDAGWLYPKQFVLEQGLQTPCSSIEEIELIVGEKLELVDQRDIPNAEEKAKNQEDKS